LEELRKKAVEDGLNPDDVPTKRKILKGSSKDQPDQD